MTSIEKGTQSSMCPPLMVNSDKGMSAGLTGTRSAMPMMISGITSGSMMNPTTGDASGAPWNDAFFEHERFNKLLVEARAELDGARRAEMYREMQVILRDEGGVVILLFADNVFAMSNKVGHPDAMSGNWEQDGGRLLERWWFK